MKEGRQGGLTIYGQMRYKGALLTIDQHDKNVAEKIIQLLRRNVGTKYSVEALQLFNSIAPTALVIEGMIAVTAKRDKAAAVMALGYVMDQMQQLQDVLNLMEGD